MGMLYEIAQRLKNAKVQVHLGKDNFTEKKGDSNEERGNQPNQTGSIIVDLGRRKGKS
jgi:hypothetical protein